MSAPERKRQRTEDYSFTETQSMMAADVRSRRSAFLASLKRGVSPPARRESSSSGETTEMGMVLPEKPEEVPTKRLQATETPGRELTNPPNHRIVSSPFKLTHIRGLPANANADTIGIKDILGDAMLKEVWLFDFLYDVNWLMQQFDPDVQHLVSIVLVHGSWRREDSNKIHIDEASKRYSNIRVVTAHMPEMYGCHHSKSMVLFRHDDLAQVIVHTANMIEQDWRNLSQAVWLSPLLSLQASNISKLNSGSPPAIGTGARFKQDLMAYLRHYGNRTSSLTSQLERYDFTSVRAALIAHVPAKFDGKETEPTAQLWGWPALKRALVSVTRCDTAAAEPTDVETPHVVCQVSSIASLSDKWFRETLFPTLSHSSTVAPSLSPTNSQLTQFNHHKKPKISIIFPTPVEVRTSLDGYAAGGSIHCKLQTAAQRKQFNFMRSHLCRWNPSSAPIPTTPLSVQSTTTPRIIGQALRGPAAPHIKTFIRFNDADTHDSIDWALLTSANLSTQAWGTEANAKSGEVRISSYELGVLVWPDLFLQDEEHEGETGNRVGEGTAEGGRPSKKARQRSKGRRIAKMIPTFCSDTPTLSQIENTITKIHSTNPQQLPKIADHDSAKPETRPNPKAERELTARPASRPKVETANNPNPISDPNPEIEHLTIIGLRMPYDLPLIPYGPDDEVWSARASYAEPDVFGRTWNLD